MKLLHLSDLHIGKNVNGFSMLDEQKFVLEQALELIQNYQIEAVLIAGDIFDKPIPSLQALELFNDFVSKLNTLSQKIYIISGNHDNIERISYLSAFLKKSDIFICPVFDGKIESIKHNEVLNIWLMPYLYPAIIRKFYPDSKIESYNDAFEVLIQNQNIDKSKINILLAHQFVIGTENPTVSDSEQKSVGGVDSISYELFSDFDYTALGHLHCPQKVGCENIRYGGSILKYSFSELNQRKCFTVIDIKDKDNITCELINIKPNHDLVELNGFIDEFLDKDFYSKIDKESYFHFILKDEYVLDAKKKLSSIYPNIMLLEFDNSFTKNLNNIEFKSDVKNKSLVEHFSDFYNIQYGYDISDARKDIIVTSFDEIMRGEDHCSLKN